MTSKTNVKQYNYVNNKFNYYKNLIAENDKIMKTYKNIINKHNKYIKNNRIFNVHKNKIIELLNSKILDIKSKIAKFNNNNNIFKEHLLLLCKQSRHIKTKQSAYISKLKINKPITIRADNYNQVQNKNIHTHDHNHLLNNFEDNTNMLDFLHNYHILEDYTNLNNLF